MPENSGEILIPTHLKTNGRLTLNIGDSICLDIGRRVAKDGIELNQSNPFQPNDFSETKIDVKTGEVITESEGIKSNENIVDTISKTYEIVGIIERPATNIEEYSAPGYTFITFIDENNILEKVDVFAKYSKTGIKNANRITANIIRC